MPLSRLYGKYVTTVSLALATATYSCAVAAAMYLLFSHDVQISHMLHYSLA